MIFSITLESFSESLFSYVCHQDASILIALNGRTVMLCPRCSGLQAGFFITMLVLLLINGVKNLKTGRAFKSIVVVALLFLFSEWMLAQTGMIHSTASSRLLSGLAGGVAFSLLAIAYRNQFVGQSSQLASRIYQLIPMIFIILFLGLLLFHADLWSAVTLLLVLAVIMNGLFILQTVILRVYALFVKTKNTNE